MGIWVAVDLWLYVCGVIGGAFLIREVNPPGLARFWRLALVTWPLSVPALVLLQIVLAVREELR